jgi:hypothetical protein
VSVDLRVNRISAISGHMHRLEARRMRRGASGTPACACLPNDAYAQRWRLIRQTLIYLQPLLATTSAACPRGNLICSTNEQAFYRLSEAEVVVGVR